MSVGSPRGLRAGASPRPCGLQTGAWHAPVISPKEKLSSGVKQYLEDEDKPYNILVDAEDSVGCSKGVYELDCCMVDATVADMIIQYAIFDDVIYG